MKRVSTILPLLAIFSGHVLAEPFHASRIEPSPAACKVSADLFWIADTGKMDTLLAGVDLATIRSGAHEGEVLPDTRMVWRDYAREATVLSARGKRTEAANRIAQMLKLAALYRAFGGLQNVVQGEEIRFLAGQTMADIGCTDGGKIDSPYLEKTAAESFELVEQKIGAEKNEVTASFWMNLKRNSLITHARLSGNRPPTLAAAP